jgi:Rv2258c-like winged HTH domain
MSETRPSSKFDSQKAEAFAARLLSTLNSGGLCLMASIGHRTGLFDAMRDQPPMTSVEIAVKAGLNERYVQAVVSLGWIYQQRRFRTRAPRSRLEG